MKKIICILIIQALSTVALANLERFDMVLSTADTSFTEAKYSKGVGELAILLEALPTTSYSVEKKANYIKRALEMSSRSVSNLSSQDKKTLKKSFALNADSLAVGIELFLNQNPSELNTVQEVLSIKK